MIIVIRAAHFVLFSSYFPLFVCLVTMKMNFFPSHLGHTVMLISDSMALSQASAEATACSIPWSHSVAWCACLPLSLRWYQIVLRLAV